MRAPGDSALALAYVDGCLPPAAAADFEARLRADAPLKAEVELWRRQNAALRQAFAPRRATGAAAPALRPAANFNARMAPNADIAVLKEMARAAAASPKPAAAGAPRRWWLALPGCLALALSAAWPADPAAALRAEAEGAWRTYVGEAPAPTAASADAQGANPQLTALLKKSWRIPSASGAARFVLEAAPSGARLGVLAVEADAPPAFALSIQAQGDIASASWSDGRRLIAVTGAADAATIEAEARRLGAL